MDSIISKDLSNQNLDKIPDYIFKLTNLQHFYIYNNAIKKIPETIGMQSSIAGGALKNLERFYINNNIIKKLPETIGQLKNLQFFLFIIM